MCGGVALFTHLIVYEECWEFAKDLVREKLLDPFRRIEFRFFIEVYEMTTIRSLVGESAV